MGVYKFDDDACQSGYGQQCHKVSGLHPGGGYESQSNAGQHAHLIDHRGEGDIAVQVIAYGAAQRHKHHQVDIYHPAGDILVSVPVIFGDGGDGILNEGQGGGHEIL